MKQSPILMFIRTCPISSLLIALNILVYLAMLFAGISPTSPTSQELVQWGANFAPLTLTGDWWRLFSSMFLHIGIVHLFMNMTALFFFGVYAERYYGKVYFGMIYLFGGLFGSLMSAYFNLNNTLALLQNTNQTPAISAGASGAIMALGGSLLVAAFLPKADLQPEQALNKNSLLMLAVINIAFGIFVGGVDNAAHFGGVCTGMLIALVFRGCLSMRNRTMSWVVTGVMLLLLTASALWTLSRLEARSIVLMPLRAELELLF